MPSSFFRRISSYCISCRSFKSSAPSGSSRSRTFGSLTIARAIAIRCCWPPERSAGERFSYPSRLTSFKAYLILSSIYALDFLLIFSPKAMFSAIVICVKRAYFWNTVFNWRLFGGSWVISCPLNKTFPASGVSKPPRIRNVVVFPQPLGPRRVRNSFSRI